MVYYSSIIDKNITKRLIIYISIDTKTIAAARARVNKEYRTYKGENCRQIIQQVYNFNRGEVKIIITELYLFHSVSNCPDKSWMN